MKVVRAKGLHPQQVAICIQQQKQSHWPLLSLPLPWRLAVTALCLSRRASERASEWAFQQLCMCAELLTSRCFHCQSSLHRSSTCCCLQARLDAWERPTFAHSVHSTADCSHSVAQTQPEGYIATCWSVAETTFANVGCASDRNAYSRRCGNANSVCNFRCGSFTQSGALPTAAARATYNRLLQVHIALLLSLAASRFVHIPFHSNCTLLSNKCYDNWISQKSNPITNSKLLQMGNCSWPVEKIYFPKNKKLPLLSTLTWYYSLLSSNNPFEWSVSQLRISTMSHDNISRLTPDCINTRVATTF